MFILIHTWRLTTNTIGDVAFDTEASMLVSKNETSHIEALYRSLICFAKKHVIYDVRGFIRLKTTWLLRYPLQTKRTSAPFPLDYNLIMR